MAKKYTINLEEARSEMKRKKRVQKFEATGTIEQSILQLSQLDRNMLRASLLSLNKGFSGVESVK